MTRHFQREIEKIKKRILSLSALVEERLRQAVKAIAERDGALAEQVRRSDWEIDQMEVEIEEDCLKILALHQPVAIDLRFIIAALKINNDLERIGDLAVSIAKQGMFLAGRPPINIPFDFPRMASLAQEMLKGSIDSLVEMDSALAARVCLTDDEIDDLHRQMYKHMEEAIGQHPERIDDHIRLLAVSRNLERIADHSTNICEDVIYMVDGVITRHNINEYVPGTEAAEESESSASVRREPPGASGR